MTKNNSRAVDAKLEMMSQSAQVEALLRDLNIFRETFPSAKINKTIADYFSRILKNETLIAVGEALQSYKQQLDSPDSRLNEVLRGVSQWKSALDRDIANPSSTLSRAAKAVTDLEATWKSKDSKAFFEFVHGEQNLELYELVRSGRIAPAQIQEGLELVETNSKAVSDSVDFSDQKQSEGAVAEIVKSILESGGLKGVSSKGLSYFLAFILALSFLMEISNKGHDFYKNISEHFQDAKTPAEIRSLTRQPPVGVDRADLSGVRVVTGDNLNLRDGAHKDSLIVQVLPFGTPVQVLDDSQRSWIFVSAVVDGEPFEGWVLRRYTKRIP